MTKYISPEFHGQKWLPYNVHLTQVVKLNVLEIIIQKTYMTNTSIYWLFGTML